MEGLPDTRWRICEMKTHANLVIDAEKEVVKAAMDLREDDDSMPDRVIVQAAQFRRLCDACELLEHRREATCPTCNGTACKIMPEKKGVTTRWYIPCPDCENGSRT